MNGTLRNAIAPPLRAVMAEVDRLQWRYKHARGLTMLLFVFAIACNILALLAALIVFLLLAFIDAWEPKPHLRLLVRSLSFVSAVIPAVGLWLCFNHRLGIGAGVGFSALVTYLAVGRYLLSLIELVARP